MFKFRLNRTGPFLIAVVTAQAWGCGPSSGGTLMGAGGDGVTDGRGGAGGASGATGGAAETGTGGATGGAKGAGGVSGTGGTTSTGGAPGTGGERGSGGAIATGERRKPAVRAEPVAAPVPVEHPAGVRDRVGAPEREAPAATRELLARRGHATGAAGTGGSSVTGSGGSASGTGGSPPAGSCGATPNALPFGCKFAWGVNGESPTTFNYVQFISNWAGYNIQSNGTFSSCDQCGWLKSTMGNSPQVPALIAYLIGYYGHALGYQDGNVNPNGPNLTNSMGPVLLGTDNASCPSGTICAGNVMVKAYAWYAAQVYASYKKPILWLMEGDFIQYSIEGSASGLSYDQLGQLAAQITNAIKCNDPTAIIAWNYSTWISTSQRDLYFNALNTNMVKLGTSYEMVFTTGNGSSNSAGSGTTWAQLYAAAGNKPIYSDESFGLSAAGDSWANQSAATIDARIAGHVVAANITTATPSYLQSNLTSTLAPSALDTTCF